MSAPVGKKPKPFRVIPSVWSPGKLAVQEFVPVFMGHAYRNMTTTRFNSIASAMNWLEREIKLR